MKRNTIILCALAFSAVLSASRIGAEEQPVRIAMQAQKATVVQLKAVVVSLASPDFFYVQDPNRVTGIRVEKIAHSAKPGDKVDVTGRLQTSSNGERLITADTVTITGNGPVFRPLAMNNRSLGGWSWRWVKDADNNWTEVWTEFPSLTNGLLILTWGRVTKVDPNGGYLFIDDGSHLSDYAKTHTGVKVVISSGSLDPSKYTVGSFLVVPGVCARYKDETTADLLPIIYARSLSDIQIAAHQ